MTKQTRTLEEQVQIKLQRLRRMNAMTNRYCKFNSSITAKRGKLYAHYYKGAQQTSGFYDSPNYTHYDELLVKFTNQLFLHTDFGDAQMVYVYIPGKWEEALPGMLSGSKRNASRIARPLRVKMQKCRERVIAKEQRERLASQQEEERDLKRRFGL